MDYIGFILLLVGAASMDGNTIVAGIMALSGAVILLVRGGGRL